MSKHTPTPWKVVVEHSFANGYYYTSIQPVDVDLDTMEHLRMANGEHHVCRMTHTTLSRKFDLFREDAEFIVTAVNAHEELLAALKGVLVQIKETSAWDDANNGEDDAMVAAVSMAERAIAKAGV